jgi:hypothetical protein
MRQSDDKGAAQVLAPSSAAADGAQHKIDTNDPTPTTTTDWH